MVHAVYVFVIIFLPFTCWSAEKEKLSLPSSVSTGVLASSSSPTAIPLEQALDLVTVEPPTLPLRDNHARYEAEVATMRSAMAAKFEQGRVENRNAAVESPVLNELGGIDIPATCNQFKSALTIVSSALIREACETFGNRRRASFSALADHLSPKTQEDMLNFCADMFDRRSSFNVNGIGESRDALETLISAGDIR